jgi:penicillin-binding protein 2
MANMAATIANRGYYYTPHIVKGIEGQDTISSRFSVKHSPDIDPRYFDIIVQGMQQAVNLPGGTAVVAALPNIIVCGKTGTAQNPHGNDHSIFIAFAPRDTPRIAISVYVENAGFGATYAGRIATLMIEKYLTDTITRPWIEDYLQNVVIDYSEKKSKHMD